MLYRLHSTLLQIHPVSHQSGDSNVLLPHLHNRNHFSAGSEDMPQQSHQSFSLPLHPGATEGILSIRTLRTAPLFSPVQRLFLTDNQNLCPYHKGLSQSYLLRNTLRFFRILMDVQTAEVHFPLLLKMPLRPLQILQLPQISFPLLLCLSLHGMLLPHRSRMLPHQSGSADF